jgi:hypothetical protein
MAVAIPGIFISYSLLPPLDGSYMFQKKDPTFTFCFSFFCIFFCGLDCLGHSFANVPLFIFLRDVWIRTQIGAGESRRYQLSHSPNLAIHFCLVFYVTWKDHNISFPVDRSFFLEHEQIL